MKKNNELNRFYDLMEEIETSSNDEDVTEEDVTEAENDALTESLPCGGVFKGDFYEPKKNQIRAANREWRRRKSTGRFSDDGSRWN